MARHARPFALVLLAALAASRPTPLRAEPPPDGSAPDDAAAVADASARAPEPLAERVRRLATHRDDVLAADRAATDTARERHEPTGGGR